MDGYVAKPIRARELFAAMEQVLRQHAPGLLDRGVPGADGGADAAGGGEHDGRGVRPGRGPGAVRRRRRSCCAS